MEADAIEQVERIAEQQKWAGASQVEGMAEAVQHQRGITRTRNRALGQCWLLQLRGRSIQDEAARQDGGRISPANVFNPPV